MLCSLILVHTLIVNRFFFLLTVGILGQHFLFLKRKKLQWGGRGDDRESTGGLIPALSTINETDQCE